MTAYEYDNCEFRKDQCAYNLKCNGPMEQLASGANDAWYCTSYYQCENMEDTWELPDWNQDDGRAIEYDASDSSCITSLHKGKEN